MWDWLAANPSLANILLTALGVIIGIVAKAVVDNRNANTRRSQLQHDIEESLWERTQDALEERDRRILALEREQVIDRAYTAYLLDGHRQWIEYAKTYKRKIVFEAMNYDQFKQRYSADDLSRPEPRFRWPFGSSE